MATTQAKADRMIRMVDEAVTKAMNELSIARGDVNLRLSIDVETKRTYDLHEDEN